MKFIRIMVLFALIEQHHGSWYIQNNEHLIWVENILEILKYIKIFPTHSQQTTQPTVSDQYHPPV